MGMTAMQSGQLQDVLLSFPCVGPGMELSAQAVRLACKSLFLLNHLTGPKNLFVFPLWCWAWKPGP